MLALDSQQLHVLPQTLALDSQQLHAHPSSTHSMMTIRAFDWRMFVAIAIVLADAARPTEGHGSQRATLLCDSSTGPTGPPTTSPRK